MPLKPPAWPFRTLSKLLHGGIGFRVAPLPPDFLAPGGPRLWLHAAGRNEARLARLLAAELLAEAPALRLLLTASQHDALPALGLGASAICRFLPADSSSAWRRLWAAFKPEGLVFLEKVPSAWPRSLELGQAVPVWVANARFAAASPQALAAGAPPDGVTYLARHDLDFQALREAGVGLERLLVCGEMKIDLALSEVRARREGEVPCFLGVSTHREDEALLLAAYRLLRAAEPRLRLVLAPYNPRRAAAVCAFAQAQGFVAQLDTAGTLAETLSAQSPEVLIEAGFGRLASWYAAAQAAYVGGALTDKRGGHNLCEPVLHGVPVLSGPQVGSWRPFAQQLDEAGVLSFVQTPEDVARLVALCVNQASELAPVLALGRAHLCQHRGATRRQAALILEGLRR